MLRVRLTEGGGRRSRSYVIRFRGREISYPGCCTYLAISIPPGVSYAAHFPRLSRYTGRIVHSEGGRGE